MLSFSRITKLTLVLFILFCRCPENGIKDNNETEVRIKLLVNSEEGIFRGAVNYIAEQII